MANENIQELKFQVGEAWKGVYSSITAYGLANVVQDATGLSIYRSLKSGNVGHPVTDTSWWFCIIDLSSIKEESDRIAAINQAIAQDETLRVAAEELRQQHEAQRISAETQRNESEQARIAAEQQRVTKESQREVKEQQRITAEQGRVSAESARVQAEQARALAETLRANAEDARAAAEINRNAAEQQRIANEQARETQYAADHTRAEADHETAVQDNAQMTELVERADADHVQAGQDHTRAESDHTTAASDHTQAGSDHTTAAADHTQAGQDHTRAESDHTRAESDHAAVEVYVDSLGAFDISAYHATGGVLAEYADLTAALGTNGANIPDALRKGGMSVKFVQSSDNKYVQYRLMSDSWSIDTNDWAINDEGVYVENPEFIHVKLDAEDKILWAIKKDGGIYYGAGVPQQVIDYINEKIAELSLDEYEDMVAFLNDLEKGDKTLQDLLDTKVDKEEGKSLIDAEYASSIQFIENPEFIEVKLDSKNRIIWAIKTDGTIYYGAGIPTQIAEYILEVANSKVDKEVGKSLISSEVADCQSMIENPEYIQVTIDNNDKVLEGITLGGKKQINLPIDTPAATTEYIDSSEWVKVVLDKEGKILFGIKVNGDIYPPSVDPEIQQDVEELKEDVSTLNQRVENCEQEAASSLEAYSSIASNIEALNEGVNRNAQEINRIKEIEGFSVAEEVEERLEDIESDVSDLKSQTGVGTDIISLNGGDKTIKDVLYGFKSLSFRNITNVPRDSNYYADSLVLLHFSDIHDSDVNAARIKTFFDTYRMINGTVAIDDALFTGDLVNYTFGRSKYGENRNEWADWGIEDVLFGIGNHDIIMGVSAWIGIENGSGWGRVPTKDNYDYFIAPYVSRWNVVQPTDAATKGKLYYYKDYPTLGYRLIMLDCFVHKKPYRNDGGTLTEIPNTWTYDPTHILASLDNIDTITNAVVGTLFYVTVVANSTYDTYVVDSVSGNQITSYTPVVWQFDEEYKQEQNTWLEETLAGAKALDYHCITTRHNAGVGTPVDCYWHADGTERNGNPGGGQASDIDRICGEFVNNGGVIVCDLNGHWHCNRVQYSTNNILSICVDAAKYSQDYGYNIRIYNEKSMDAFNLVAFNKANGCITLYRIGVDKNKDGKGHQILIYDYINKKIKYQY